MKLSEWAKKQGISYRAAWNGYRQGKLPVPAKQLPTGTIIVQDEPEDEGIAVIYARVLSRDLRPKLDGQVARCLEACKGNG